MRISKLTFTIAAVFASVASCQMVVPALLDEEEAGERGPGATTQQMEALAKLAKLRELAEMQEASGDGNKYHILPLKSSSDEAAVTGERLICDVLPTERSISIFFDLIMSDYDLASRIGNKRINSTLLVPSNLAIQSMGYKPWQPPQRGNRLSKEAAIAEEGAQNNIRAFVERHIVPQSPLEEGQKYATLAEGEGGVQFSRREDGNLVVQPGEITVLKQRATANGEIWILEGVLDQ